MKTDLEIKLENVQGTLNAIVRQITNTKTIISQHKNKLDTLVAAHKSTLDELVQLQEECHHVNKDGTSLFVVDGSIARCTKCGAIRYLNRKPC